MGQGAIRRAAGMAVGIGVLGIGAGVAVTCGITGGGVRMGPGVTIADGRGAEIRGWTGVGVAVISGVGSSSAVVVPMGGSAAGAGTDLGVEVIEILGVLTAKGALSGGNGVGSIARLGITVCTGVGEIRTVGTGFVFSQLNIREIIAIARINRESLNRLGFTRDFPGYFMIYPPVLIFPDIYSSSYI